MQSNLKQSTFEWSLIKCLTVHYSGPFRYADIYGSDKIVAKMREFQEVYGERFAPCQLLVDHANDPSKKFHSQ